MLRNYALLCCASLAWDERGDSKGRGRVIAHLRSSLSLSEPPATASEPLELARLAASRGWSLWFYSGLQCTIASVPAVGILQLGVRWRAPPGTPCRGKQPQLSLLHR